ncbi:hypothetical protein ACWEQ4_03655 [Rhodococcus sp. NPDC003994]
MRQGKLAFLGTGLADQGASSATTLLISIFSLRHADSDGAWVFSAGILIYGIAIAAARSVTSELLAVFRDQHKVFEPADVQARFLHRGIAIGCLGAAAVVLIGASSSLILATILGLAIIPQVGADTLRTAFVVTGETKRAVIISGTTLAATIAGGAMNELMNASFPVFATWGLAGVGFCVLFLRRQLRSAMPVLPMSNTFLLEAAVTTAASQLAVLLGVAVTGPDLAIVARVMATAFGVYTLFYQAVALLVYPFVARQQTRTKPVTVWFGVSGVLTAVLATCIGLMFLFARLVEPASIFGESWDIAKMYLSQYAAVLLIGTTSAATFLTLRVVQRTRVSLRVRIGSGLLNIAVPVGLGAVSSIQGFYVGVGLASLLVGMVGLLLALMYTKEKVHA